MNADFYLQHQSFSTRSGRYIETIHTLHGYSCAGCGCGSSFPIAVPLRSDVQALIDAGICPYCDTAITYGTFHWYSRTRLCSADGCAEVGTPRLSLGLPAGHWCDRHYATAFPYRTDGAEGFDPAFAGEHYDEE
jgi:hypothetical protein